ncbi:hypothetical protein AaE_012621 [Aphanomyces astaci]|uniref:Tc1-like transposase DDE domain-containing protein n=1 Tax=Aphanomyces astaci TaxID=112090 RepID=A0A6A4ZMD9_APHAT|nr:hypothetical protein AaE_012621 [Aphanomyces astaci]
MPRGKNITDIERGQIKAYLRLKKPLRWIARALGRSDKLVRTCIANFARDSAPSGGGRRLKMTRREVRRIFRLATRKGMSARQISAALDGKVKRTCVLTVLKMSKFAKYIKRRSGPRLTSEHRKCRVEFASKQLNTLESMKTTLFTDEKKFNLDGPDGCQYYWHDLRNEVETYSKRASGYYNKTELAFLEGRQDSAKYKNTLRGYMIPAMRDLSQKSQSGTAVFQQDNASIHTSKLSTTWLKQLAWPTMDWPSKSPDLNPIENVWGVLARKVYANGRQFDSKEGLKAQILASWREIDQEYLHHLVDGMPTRVAQIILRRGHSIDK